MRSPHQKKEIHFIGSGQLRKSISKKTVKKRANAKPHQMRPSSHFRRCSAAAQSRTDLRWRTQTLAIRTGCKLWSKADVEKNCLDWPSLRQPWQFCSSLPSAQSGRLSHLSDVNTWTQSSTQKRIQTFVVEYNYVQWADLLHSSTHFPSPQSCWKSGHCTMLENDLNTYDTAYWSAEKAREEIKLYII